MAFDPFGNDIATSATAALASLRTAAASGLLTVQARDGRRITYQSMADLLKAVDYFEGLLNPTRGRGGVSVAAFARD